ncbi:hypothetical protein ACFFLM_10600 [Deinococcus oregonensis]|uniref:Outer membrane protein beta-barrel domain-containing protein n=1 Tax=Deinococcus oregonensis TaxID=1805970 RepID=A0ABV6AY35_9DEIO
MMKVLYGAVLAAFSGIVPLATAAAQTELTPMTANTQPKQESVTLWGGLASEFFVLPGLSLGASVPLGQWDTVNVAARAMADVILLPLPDLNVPLVPLVGADLLFSGPLGNVTVYGGPGVGTLLGQAFWVSGTAGIRNTFGGSHWGYFTELKGQYLFDMAGTGVFSPGTRLGLTYRF